MIDEIRRIGTDGSIELRRLAVPAGADGSMPYDMLRDMAGRARVAAEALARAATALAGARARAEV